MSNIERYILKHYSDPNINPATIWYKDSDGDGYSDNTTLTQCERPSGYKLASELTSTSGDCKDDNPAVNPSAQEVCGDGIDNDCNEQIDEGCCADNDGDGYNAYDAQSCPEGNDCNDNDANINPSTTWYKDMDGDKYSDSAFLTQCEQPSGYKLTSDLTAPSGDCDDTDPTLNPETIWYKDSDGDGYSDWIILTQCEQSEGYKLKSELTSTDYDCNDNNPFVNLPSIWYKDTDNDGYSDGTTMTSCTRPGGFRPASELTATSGDSDDTDGTTYPGAPEICDGKDNNQNGQIDETCCNVSVSVSPNAVWPSNAGSSQTTSTITVSLTSLAPPEGCTVNLSIEPVANSGGHSNHGGTRPKGTITDSSGNVISSVNLSNAENSAVVKYTSSDVSGEERIKATATGGNTSEATIAVRVPGLGSMGESSAWRLTGDKPIHPKNHYGTYTVIGIIGNMAADYYEETGIAIGINDMSLVWGGLFDINNNWSTPHKLHRVGKSVDVDHLGVDEKKLNRIAQKYQCERYEINLIHYECP